MKKGDFKRKSGFTIAEVSLVIAIAGLIFFMVFLALPHLQRIQRDSRRKDDISMFLSAVKDYQTNNRGALPSLTEDWKTKVAEQYIENAFVDPDGTVYTVAANACGGTVNEGAECENTPNLLTMDHTLHVFMQATCNGEQAVKTSNPRKVAVMYRLEGAGIYCGNT